jgi:putative membrane protein
MIRLGALPLAVILVASWWEPRVISALAALPLLAVGAVLDRRFSGYALSNDLLFARGGIWRQRLWMVPVANVQSMRLYRTPLQRWLGLATLGVDTAGAPSLGGLKIVDLDLAIAQAMTDQIAARLAGRVS